MDEETGVPDVTVTEILLPDALHMLKDSRISVTYCAITWRYL